VNRLAKKIPTHIKQRGISASTTGLLIVIAIYSTWSLHYNFSNFLGHNASFFEALSIIFKLPWKDYVTTILLVAGAIYKLKKMFGTRKDRT
jgi:hypothetical protein